MTEKEMRDATVPWPNTLEELTAYIKPLVEQEQDYGTCVYAMSMAATAAFRYVAHALGVSGFQASCADLDIIRRTRSWEGPLLLTNAEDTLYPQYDVRAKLEKCLKDWEPWAMEQAKKKLTETANGHAHPDVKAHWERLAAGGTL
jgi:hypothetical protein